MRWSGVLLGAALVGCENSTDRARAAMDAHAAQAADEEKRLEAERQLRADRNTAALEATRPKAARPKPVAGLPEPPPEDERSAVVAWIRQAESECALSLSVDHCDSPPPGALEEDASACKTSCRKALAEAYTKRFAQSFDDCVAGALTVPPSAPRCELADEILKLMSDKEVTDFRQLCSGQCMDERKAVAAGAKQREIAANQGARLVLSYKRCMLAQDQTTRAISYRLHDRDLYVDLMQATDARCRGANRCDWLEKYSDARCEYGN